MYYNFLKIVSILLLSAGFCACKKQAHHSNDKSKPIITVAEPMVGDTLSLASDPEVHIEFTVTDETGLHELQVLLIKNNTDTIFNDSPSVNDLKTYAYHEHIIPTGVTVNTPMKVIISANDHGDNKELKTIDFIVEP